MANAKYERARARARLALIAPTVDDVTAAYFDGQVEKVLLEAKQRGERSDRELISTLLDAVARKYFALGLSDLRSRAKRGRTSTASHPDQNVKLALQPSRRQSERHLFSAVNLIHRNVTASRICTMRCKLMQECALFDLALALTNTYF